MKESVLKLSPDLALPVTAVTSKLAFFGGNGAGKSYAAMKLAEEMWDVGAQFIAFDPVGIWYGLRIGEPGIPIAVFGGLHGDIPIAPHDGKLVAEAIVGEGISAVVDVSQFETDAQKGTFASDFAERFFFLKKASPSAVHIFLEEAQEFVPENPAGGPSSKETLMANRFQRIWKIGRNYGIAGSLITPRPQEISKKVLNLCECIFVFRLTGSHERDYIDKWFKGHGETGLGEQLPRIEPGHCYAWSPGWLKFSGFIAIGSKRTHDVSATPRVGIEVAERSLASVAVDALRLRLAKSSEELEPPARGKKNPDVTDQIETAIKPWRERCEQLEAVIAQAKGTCEFLTAAAKDLTELSERFRSILDPVRIEPIPVKVVTESVTHNDPTTIVSVPRKPIADRKSQPQTQPSEGLSKSQQAILDALATLAGQGLTQAKKQHVALFADASPKSSGFTNNLGRLRSLGLIDYPQPGFVALTLVGRQKAVTQDAPLTLSVLHQRWCALLSRSQGIILRECIACYPRSIDKVGLAALVGVSIKSSGYTNNLGHLRSLCLIDYPSPGFVVATDLLFPEGLK